MSNEKQGAAPRATGARPKKMALCRNCQAVHVIGSACQSGSTMHSRSEATGAREAAAEWLKNRGIQNDRVFHVRLPTDEESLRLNHALLSEVLEAFAACQDVHIDFSESPCGHSSQYAYAEDGGKHIVCLICERDVACQSATPRPACPTCGNGKLLLKVDGLKLSVLCQHCGWFPIETISPQVADLLPFFPAPAGGDRPAQCAATLANVRCDRPEGHDGIHQANDGSEWVSYNPFQPEPPQGAGPDAIEEYARKREAVELNHLRASAPDETRAGEPQKRCCENGNFGEPHECRKQPGQPHGPLSERFMRHHYGASGYVDKSLLHKPSETAPAGCHCEPGKCAAPVIMGRQMPCRDLDKANAKAAHKEPSAPDETRAGEPVIGPHGAEAISVDLWERVASRGKKLDNIIEQHGFIADDSSTVNAIRNIARAYAAAAPSEAVRAGWVSVADGLPEWGKTVEGCCGMQRGFFYRTEPMVGNDFWTWRYATHSAEHPQGTQAPWLTHWKEPTPLPVARAEKALEGK